MRDRKILYGKRKQIKNLLQSARRLNLSKALISRYESELEQITADLSAIDRFGGEVVMMRTPWKRLTGDSRKYFEVEGQ